jgi:lysyl-tRNA synthetase class 2
LTQVGAATLMTHVVDRNHVPPLAILRARKRMNDAVRAFFDSRGLLEVETPIAVPSPGLEPHLWAFETEEVGPDAAATKLYLHTSPEYAMKRMLGRGIDSIYQIARVFRNGERSRTHAPEFTMLEWYRSPGALEEIMTDAAELFEAVAEAVDGPWRPSRIERVSVS